VDDEIETPARGAALSELIEVEQQIATEVAAARAEADQLIEAAREYAAAVEQNDDGTVAEAIFALRRSIDEDCESAIRTIDADGAALADRYDGLDDSSIERLAGWVVSQIVGAEPAP